MDKVLFHPNERVDLVDVEHMSDSIAGELNRLSRGLLGDYETIVSGFFYSLPGAGPNYTTMQINAGVALLTAEDADYGQLITDDATPSSQTVSFAGLPAATLGVWIRFNYVDGEQGNRAFWDPDAVAETVQSVNTRKVADWDVQVSAMSPGDEWLRIFSVAWDGTSLHTSVITDKRRLLFEGVSEAQYLGAAPVIQNAAAAFATNWGGGTDRNSDRGQYPITNLHDFVRAMLQKLEDIQGVSARWFEAPAVALDGKVTKAGDTMTGDLTISKSAPLLNMRNTGENASKIHFYDADLEGTEFFDVEYDAGAHSASMNVGTGGTWFLKQNGTNKLGLASGGGLLLYTTLIPNVDANTIGTLADPFDGYFEQLHITDSLLPTADGNNLGAAAAGFRFDAFLMYAQFYDAGDNTSPIKNRLNARNIPKAWATITTDGAGNVTLAAGCNIASVVFSGTTIIVVAFAQDFDDANACVVVTPMNGNVDRPVVGIPNAGGFEFSCERGGGSINLTTTATRFAVVAFGVQT